MNVDSLSWFIFIVEEITGSIVFINPMFHPLGTPPFGLVSNSVDLLINMSLRFFFLSSLSHCRNLDLVFMIP